MTLNLALFSEPDSVVLLTMMATTVPTTFEYRTASQTASSDCCLAMFLLFFEVIVALSFASSEKQSNLPFRQDKNDELKRMKSKISCIDARQSIGQTLVDSLNKR